MPDLTFNVAGMPVAQVLEQVQKAGISRSDASILVGSWIFENVGRTQRTFNYATAFPAADPSCVSSFTKSFAHQDWVDGESVVQAEQTTGEEGFNLRFHRIEADLAGLGQEVAHAFNCLATMRREIRSLLDELRAEVNRLNSDVFEQRTQGSAASTTPGLGRITDVLDGPRFKGVTKFLDKDVAIWQTDQGMMVLPAVTPIAASPQADPRVRRVKDLHTLVTENEQLRTTFAGRPVTKAELVTQFGELRGEEGIAVKELVAILPDDQSSFDSLDALADAVAEREAGAIRTNSEREASLTSALNVGSTGSATIGSASVTALENITPAASAALAGSGITTLDNLATADPVVVANKLTASGVRVTAGEVAGWKGQAKVLSKIRPIR